MSYLNVFIKYQRKMSDFKEFNLIIEFFVTFLIYSGKKIVDGTV